MNYLKRISVLWMAILCLNISILANNGIANENLANKPAYKVSNNRYFKQLNQLNKKNVLKDKSYYLDDLVVPVTQEDRQIRSEIEATYNKVVAENRFVQFLDENALIDLPIGIKTDIGALSYLILIDSLILTPEGTSLFASMSFEAPGMGKIHFRGTGIKFSKTGGLADGGFMELVGNYPFKLNQSNTQQLIIKGDEQRTFVEFDCNGFKQMSLDANIVFSRDQLLPEDENGEVIPERNVEVGFTTILSDWNDLIVAVDFPRFQLRSLKDFSFKVKQAIVDLSDLRNTPAILFPEGYQNTSPYLQSGNPNLWRGVYINEVSVLLPPQFVSKGESSNNRVSFNGYHLLIDDQGFSGMVAAKDLISIDHGKIANWDFSLDEIHLAVVANEVKEAGLRGKINVPINDVSQGEVSGDRLFQYTALLLPGNEYLFNVTNPDEVSFDLWKTSEVTLHPSSYIEIQLRDNEFLPRAHLNGEMTIEAGLKEGGAPNVDSDKNVKLAGIEFQNLEIQSVKPYVKVGSFSLGTKSNNLGGYPITVNRIEGGQNKNELFLDVDVTLALTGNEGGGFGAGGGVRFISEGIEEGDHLSYQYKNIEITRFAINIDQGAFALLGNLNFYKADPVYGNGLSGTVDARFTQIKLQASAVFGTKDDYRYWYVDANADLGKNVPLFTGIYLSQFGGGASYHMQRDDQRIGSELGKTASGIVYVPNRSAGLGVKAMAGLRGEDEKLFHAEAVFEMLFRSGGGVKNINFRGNAFLLSNPKPISTQELSRRSRLLAGMAKQSNELNQDPTASNEILGPPDTQGAQIYAGVFVNYDFDNRTLHANLRAVINVAGGVVTGGGDAVMHFSPDDWYIYLGRPEYANRFNLNLLGLAQADAYFVMGSSVPDSPPPPENVSAILGGINLDYMGELNALVDGQGVGFGASLRVDTGDKTFLIFYGRFQAGVGFDVMMRNYGGVTCGGRGALGIDGWYANGQAYAYFDGKIGVKVKLFGNAKRIDILTIGAAVVAQAKLPNPVWIKGVVGGHFSVLGGLVKGRCSFEVVIGEECDIQKEGSALEGVEVIAQLTPQNGISDVDVFTSPQAVFNYELEKTYQTVDATNKRIDFKIALDKIELSGPSGVIVADLKWNSDHTVAVLNTSEILPSQSELKLTVVTSFQELRNGKWERTIVDGKELKESRVISFTTGEAPEYIPAHNIAYCYPTQNMLNLYKREYSQGYVKLNQDQKYLFENPDFLQVVRFSSGNQVIETSLSYSQSEKEATFSIPAKLENDRIYQMNFVSLPRHKTNIEANVSTLETKVNEEGVDATIQTRTATGSVTNYEEMVIYSAWLRTSKYETFNDKLKSVQPSAGWRKPVSPGVHFIGSNINGDEPFSLEEIYGTNQNAPLIRMTADLSNNPWFEEEIRPLIYSSYPFDITHRDISKLGRIPIRAVYLYQYPYNYVLKESDLHSTKAYFTPRVGRFDYDLAIVMNQDLKDLQLKAAGYSYKNSNVSRRINNLLDSLFPRIRGGQYQIEISYYLPGRGEVTSIYEHEIINPIE